MAENMSSLEEPRRMILESDLEEKSEASISECIDSLEKDVFLQGEDPALDAPNDQEPSWASSSVPQVQSTPTKRRKVNHPSCSKTGTKGGWHSLDIDDQEPKQFMFCPKRNPGVQLDLHHEYSPLGVFQLFFTKAALDTLCQNTNKYAKHRHSQGSKQTWQGVDPEEMMGYISLSIYMGLVRFSCIKDMWRTDELHRHPFPASVMAGRRFHVISSFLHMSDPEADVTNDKLKGTPSYDPLFRVKPLHDDIITSCRAYYHPHQNVAIDERMVPAKNRHSMKQHMKDKPTKWGFKLFVLADSLSGYTFNFSVYQGKAFTPSGNGLSFDAVVKLLPLSFLGTGYRLYVDNFYTSTALFTHLHTLNIGACGTIRSNRIGFLEDRPNALPKDASRGDMRWLRQGHLLYVKWKDSREVGMCSSIHKAFSGHTILRRVKKADGWKQESVPVPDLVLDYNKYMGGVDLSDAFIKHYTIAKKSIKWYKKFFFHFVDIALVNSYIIHKDITLAKKQKPLTQKRFREVLVMQLAACGRANVVPRVLSHVVPRASEKPEKEQMMCFPVAIIDTSSVDPRLKATQGRKYCVHCTSKKLKNKTIYKCVSCDVPLCIIANRICFREWHLQKKDK